MKHQCTPDTDLDELIGHDEVDGFHTGPLYTAMKTDEPLELVGSMLLSVIVRTKLEHVSHGFVVAETGEQVLPPEHFKLLLH
jgi:hypothetical protein